MKSNSDLAYIQSKIGYTFKNDNLLINAFTHSSYANENKLQSNETLEFFGDSILSFVVSKRLFNNLQIDEGQLSKYRAKIVCSDNLSDAIKNMEIQDYILVGKSLQNGLGISNAIIGDLFEAIVAAIYLDGGLAYAEKFICDNLNFDVMTNLDYKTKLQELVQAELKLPIVYKEIEKIGPAHNPIFTICLFIGEKEICTAQANNKHTAESECAKIAIEKLFKTERVWN